MILMTAGKMETLCKLCHRLIYDRVCLVCINYNESKGTNLEDPPIIFRSTYKFESLGSKGWSLCVLARAQMKPDLGIEQLQTSCYCHRKLDAFIRYSAT